MLKNAIFGLTILTTLFSFSPHTLADLEPEPPATVISVRDYAQKAVTEYWAGTQWSKFDSLITRESHWNPTAKNPKSSAYGLGQFLNGTWDDVDCVKTDDPYKQIDCTISYIDARYDTPAKALRFQIANNYY